MIQLQSLTDATPNVRDRVTNPRRVCIFGASLEEGNRGVQALGASVIQQVAGALQAADIVFHYGWPSGSVKRISLGTQQIDVTVRNCRLSPRSRPAEHILVILTLALLYRLGVRRPALRNPWLRSLLVADFIGEIRGGDSFSDIYGARGFLVGSLPLLSVVLLGRPYTMLPQTYGPFRSRMCRWLARLLLRRATTILTRDRSCEVAVRQLSGRTAQYCPDVAFTLEAQVPPQVAFFPANPNFGDGLTIGVNVSGLLYMGGYTGRNMFGLRAQYRELIDQLMRALLSNTEARVVLVPHVVGEHEEEACAFLLESLGSQYPGRVFMPAHRWHERHSKWLIGQTDFFIGARMHACIAALSQCVPAVGLAYSDKFRGVFESAGLADAIIDLRTTAPSAVIERVFSVMEQRREIRRHLEARIPIVQEEVTLTFRGLLASTTSSLRESHFEEIERLTGAQGWHS